MTTTFEFPKLGCWTILFSALSIAACGGNAGDNLFGDDDGAGGSGGDGGSGDAGAGGSGMSPGSGGSGMVTGTGGAGGGVGGVGGGTGGAGGSTGGTSGTSGSGGTGGSEPLTCTADGKWATFIQVGVGWESFAIIPGAGVVRNWILSDREIVQGTQMRDLARSCGIEAPYFGTILDSWIGTRFLDQLFDSGSMPATELPIQYFGDPMNPQIGDAFEASPAPINHGVEGLAPTDPWPTYDTIEPYLRDHDQDGFPGITAVPLSGPVPGTDPPAVFSNPQLTLDPNADSADLLFMAISSQAGIQGEVVSCDPPRVEGTVTPGTLAINLRSHACRVAQTGEMCDATQSKWIDDNLPIFEPNGTSKVISIKVPSTTTCADVRSMQFE